MLPADIVPLSWRTDALKLACADLADALDVEIAEKFYSLTNGKALYQLSRDEVLKLRVTEKDMIVHLCSDRCVGLSIRTGHGLGPSQHHGQGLPKGQTHYMEDSSGTQQRLNQMNMPKGHGQPAQMTRVVAGSATGGTVTRGLTHNWFNANQGVRNPLSTVAVGAAVNAANAAP